MILPLQIKAATIPEAPSNVAYVLPPVLENSDIRWGNISAISSTYPVNTASLAAYNTSNLSQTSGQERYNYGIAIMYSDSFKISDYDAVTWYSCVCQRTNTSSMGTRVSTRSYSQLFLIQENDTAYVTGSWSSYVNYGVKDANGNVVTRPATGTSGTIDIKQYRESNNISADAKYRFAFCIMTYGTTSSVYSNGTVSGPYYIDGYISPAIVSGGILRMPHFKGLTGLTPVIS